MQELVLILALLVAAALVSRPALAPSTTALESLPPGGTSSLHRSNIKLTESSQAPDTTPNGPECAHLLAELAHTLPSTISLTRIVLDAGSGEARFNGYPQGGAKLHSIADAMQRLQHAHCYVDATLSSGGCATHSGSYRSYEFCMSSHVRRFDSGRTDTVDAVSSPFAQADARRETPLTVAPFQVNQAGRLVDEIPRYSYRGIGVISYELLSKNVDQNGFGLCRLVFHSTFEQAVALLNDLSTSRLHVLNISLEINSQIKSRSPVLKTTIVTYARIGTTDCTNFR